MALVATGTSYVFQLKHIFESYITLIIAFLAIGYIIIDKCIKTRNSKSPGLGKGYEFSEEKRKRAKVVIVATLILVLLLVFGTIYFNIIYKNKVNENDIGIIVTEFNNSGNDLFTNDLYSDLSNQPDIRKSDSIKVIIHNCFIAVQPNKESDTLKNIFKRNKLNKGLIVFGERNEDKISNQKIFRCMIYVNNLRGLFVDSVMIDVEGSDEKVIYIKTPLLIDFKLKEQSKKLATFILGLLQFNSKQYEKSEKTFNKIISESDSVTYSKKLIAACKLFIGNGNFGLGKYKEAIQQYRVGVEFDSTNAHLYYNLGSLSLMNKKLAEAYLFYKKAHQIDDDLLIPDIDLKKEKKKAENKRFDSKDKDVFSIDDSEFKKLETKVDWSKLGLSNENEPKVCGDFLPSDNNYLIENIPYIVLFKSDNTVQMYIDQNDNLLLFNKDGTYFFMIGRVIKKENVRFLVDNCKNIWLIDEKGYIVSKKGIVGRMYPQKK